MNDARVLLVDDESDIRCLIGIHLQAAGIQYEEAESGSQAMEWLERQSFDLLVLDLMMDDTDGIQVLKRIRTSQNQTPVIIVSAVHEIDKKIEILGLGADDYVTKPFIPGELIARIEANIRRNRRLSDVSETGTIIFDTLLLCMNSLSVENNGTRVPITQTECDLLAILMGHPGRTFSKEELYRAVWRHDHFDDNNLSVYISHLRKKIEDDPRSPRYIQTVRGIGYRFQEANQ